MRNLRFRRHHSHVRGAQQKASNSFPRMRARQTPLAKETPRPTKTQMQRRRRPAAETTPPSRRRRSRREYASTQAAGAGFGGALREQQEAGRHERIEQRQRAEGYGERDGAAQPQQAGERRCEESVPPALRAHRRLLGSAAECIAAALNHVVCCFRARYQSGRRTSQSAAHSVMLRGPRGAAELPAGVARVNCMSSYGCTRPRVDEVEVSLPGNVVRLHDGDLLIGMPGAASPRPVHVGEQAGDRFAAGTIAIQDRLRPVGFETSVRPA